MKTIKNSQAIVLNYNNAIPEKAIKLQHWKLYDTATKKKKTDELDYIKLKTLGIKEYYQGNKDNLQNVRNICKSCIW